MWVDGRPPLLGGRQTQWPRCLHGLRQNKKDCVLQDDEKELAALHTVGTRVARDPRGQLFVKVCWGPTQPSSGEASANVLLLLPLDLCKCHNVVRRAKKPSGCETQRLEGPYVRKRCGRGAATLRNLCCRSLAEMAFSASWRGSFSGTPGETDRDESWERNNAAYHD